MAANQGWFGEWYAGGWFPSVWFAPADESHLLPDELAPPPGAGAQAPVLIDDSHLTSRGRRRVIPFPDPVKPVEDDEALLLTGAL